MPVFEPAEVVNLIIAVIAIPLLLQARELRLARYRVFLWAFVAMIAALVATNAESLLWPSAFNLIEHLGYAVSGILWAVAILGQSPSPSAGGKS